MTGSGACDSQYTAAGYDEVDAGENYIMNGTGGHCDYGSGQTGCFYRFAHTFNTGTNFAFQIQNAIGNVSNDGRWAIFPSDWGKTLGCTNGTADGVSGCPLASTDATCANATGGSLATTACPRGDLFVVDLLSAH